MPIFTLRISGKRLPFIMSLTHGIKVRVCGGLVPINGMQEPLGIDGEDCNEVEAVLAGRTQKKTRKRQVLVKLTGISCQQR